MTGPRRAPWPARLALLGYVLLLGAAFGASGGRAAAGGAGLWDVHDRQGLRRALVMFALHLAVDVARFVPVGVLSVLALSPPPAGTRAGRLGLAAATLAVASMLVSVVLEVGRPWRWPSPSDVGLPLAGCLVGTWLALSWRGGRRARLLFLPKLAAVLALPFLVLALGVWTAAEPAPLDFQPAEVTSAEKRRLYRQLKDKNPRKVPPGETRTVDLTAHDIDVLFAWGLPLVWPGAKGQVELAASEAATFRASLPFGGRHLNVEGGARVRIEDGRMTLHAPSLRLGRRDVPEGLLGLATAAVTATVPRERRLAPFLAPVRLLEVRRGEATLVYGRADLPAGLLAGFIWGEGSESLVRQAVAAHVRRLLEAAPGLPAEGDGRFLGTLRTAFATARERSGEGSAVLENRAALLALGVLLGHSRLETLVGRVVDDGDWARVGSTFRGATVRGRRDWTKHFCVSAALTVLAAEAPSDATGLLKEELDADGGSGFSFADLLADRAGTVLAAEATRDEEGARRLQARLADGVSMDAVMPDAGGLPEGIADAELQARYGGVGGTLYRRYADDIEGRVAASAALRAGGGPGR